jgi:hypothetical protein
MNDDAIGRLTSAPLFPFEGDMRLKELTPLLERELPRAGEDGRPCPRCDDPMAGVIWSNERWLVTAGPRTACPVTVFLETRAHVDLGDLTDAMSAELGVLIVRIERAVNAISDVGRVHVHRWSDGSAHLHVWFVARPVRRIELYGWGNVLWNQLLPPIDQHVHDANLAVVAAGLAKSEKPSEPAHD